MIFSPAINLMNRLNVGKKFMVIGMMSLVAITVVVYSLYSSLQQVISASQKELDGIELVQPFSRAIQMLQQHRGLSAGLIGGDKSLQDRVAAKGMEAEEAFNALMQKMDLEGTQDENFLHLKNDWENLRRNGMSMSLKQNFDVHSDMVDDLQRLKAIYADRFLLTVDPDIDAHYLVTNTIYHLPQALEHLARIRGLGTGMLSEKHPTMEQEIEINAMVVELDDSLAALKEELNKTIHYNAAMKEKISAASGDIEDATRKIIEIVRLDILSGHLYTAPYDFFELTSASIDKNYLQLYDSLIPACKQLLLERMSRAKQRLYISVGIASVLFLLVIYFSIGIYYSIVSNIEILAGSAHRFASGDLSGRINVETKDELNRVGKSFNEMADGFVAMLHARLEDGARLSESESRYKRIADGLTDYRYTVRLENGHVVDTRHSPGCEAVTGYEEKDFAADPDLWIHLVAPEDRDRVAEYAQKILAGEDVPSIEYRITHKDGEPRWVSDTAILFRDAQGQLQSYDGVIKDITERKITEEHINRYIEQLEKSFMRTVEVTVTLSEMRDPYTAGHERRVADIAAAIGTEMGLDARQIEGLRVTGQLHDVGKMGLPSEILAKPGKITAAEYTLIKEHAKAGYDALKNVNFPWPVAEVAWQHHERLDGTGYPRGLKGDEILLEARITSVADVIEAMASHRPYRPGHGIDKALAEIERGSGTAFDATVVNACLRLFREKGYTLPDT